MSDSKDIFNIIYILIDIEFFIVLFLKTIVKFNKLYPVFQMEDLYLKKRSKPLTTGTLPLGYFIVSTY